MKTKFLFLFLLILLLPLAGLAWLGHRMIKEEQATLAQQVKERFQERLQNVDQILQSKLDQLAQTLSSLTLSLSDNSNYDSTRTYAKLNQRYALSMSIPMMGEKKEYSRDKQGSPELSSIPTSPLPNELPQPSSILPIKPENHSTEQDVIEQGLNDQVLRQPDVSEPTQADMIRDLISREPLIKQILILNPSRQIIFPPVQGTISQKESEFLTEIKPILPDLGNISSSEKKTEGQSLSPTNRLSESSSSNLLLGSASNTLSNSSGFSVWFWQKGMTLIFWQKTQEGNLVAIELDRSYFLSEISQVFTKINPPENGSIVMLDERNYPFYKRGDYDPKAQERAQASLVLSNPLQLWKLEYYHKGDLLPVDLKNRAVLNTLLSLCGLGLAFLGIALYFYREQNRLIAEAKKRVTFVNQVSHELKTPLTNICMYAELLETELLEAEEKAKHHIDIIVSESQRLSRLINNILLFARKQKKHILHPHPGNLNSTLEQVLQDFTPAFARKGLQAIFESGLLPEVSYDADAIEQIVANLLSNVEKYATFQRSKSSENSKQSGGCVFLRTRQEGNWVILEVQDQGPGIPTDLQEKIFEPFYRISQSMTEGVSGTGIGLTLARDLARLHGGELKVIPSEQGACFELRLPIQIHLSSE